MTLYENIIILDASMTDEAVESTAKKIKDIITSNGGEMLKADHWGRRKMAYMVNKQTRGYYILMLFKAPSKAVRPLEDFYGVQDNVIKHMIIKIDRRHEATVLKPIADAAAAAAAAATATAPQAQPAGETEAAKAAE